MTAYTQTLSDDEIYNLWADRFQQHLTGIPELLEHMRSSALYSALSATRTDTPRVGGTRDKSPLPWKGDGVDDADDLWSVLVIYSQEVAELTGGSSPTVLRTQLVRRGEVAGFRANADPLTARVQAREVVSWLIGRLDLILEHPALNDSEKHLLAAIRAGRGKYGFGPLRVTGISAGTCWRCGSEFGVTYTWVTGTDGDSTMRGRCRDCKDVT